MGLDEIDSLSQKLAVDGTIMLEIGDHPISLVNLTELEELSDALPLEHVEVGDADEINYLKVGRFLIDKDIPTLVNEPFSEKALEIVAAPEQMEFFKKLLRKERLHVRRMQMNILERDCFVGYHLDTDSNPDYLVAVVIQFGHDFAGGDYVVYGGDRPPRSFSPNRFSMIVSDCKFPHEVTKVTQGSRKSLVFFLSEWDGRNQRGAC